VSHGLELAFVKARAVPPDGDDIVSAVTVVKQDANKKTSDP
jgi:hypothetical protein